MPLFSGSNPAIRVRVLPRFPALVVAGSGMTITKSNGVYTFAAAVDNVPFSALEDVPATHLLGRDAALGVPEPIAVSNGIEFTGSDAIQLSANQRLRSLPVTIYQNGSVLTTGVKADLQVPFACTITGVTLLADQTGSVVVDIWKDTFANFPPVVGDSIVASAKPTLASAASVQAPLTGWTTALLAGDVLRFNFDSVATITRLQITIHVSVT